MAVSTISETHFTKQVKHLLEKLYGRSPLKDSLLDRAILFYKDQPFHQQKLDKLTEKITELKLLVKEIYTYIGAHFTHEEQYMLLINYPEIDRHKDLHKGMLTSLNDLLIEINLLDIDTIQKRIMAFINEYFIKHIITEDKKINLWQISLYDLRKKFGWREIYKIGDTEIDLQHKELFDIASEAFIIVNDSQRDKKITKIT